MEDCKIKPLTKDQILISIDRLTRFKETETKYLRVFKDILTHNLIAPKFGKNALDTMSYEELTAYASNILNESLKKLNVWAENDLFINLKLKDYEHSVFKISQDVDILLNNSINYSACLKLIDNDSVKNLLWLKELSQGKNIEQSRHEKSLLYPLSAVVIAEGATEEILLPEFAKIYGYDFDKEGVYVISAGGKNQVVRAYYDLCEILNIPIFVLLDKDGVQNSKEIMQKLRNMDYIHLLECGEFEDLLPIQLVKRTIEYQLKNISLIEKDMIDESVPRTEFLEEVFKNRGLHEFKKVEFAHMVKNNLKSIEDLSPEIMQIIEQIKSLNKSK
ncbi:ATP-dependent endonuclease [bacterium]|nr:ATP-dependent endonuclease [bacterium]